MASLIKKVKVMQQDGTFTDYIPIGAEAENINIDGESVEDKLSKKPYYYNSVADMKADTKLKADDMVITLGYYEVNDGGAGKYKIIDGDYNDDGGNYHQLNNGLFAELIIFKDEVNIKQFGAKNDGVFDDTNIIQTAINNNNIIFFPDGNYNITSQLTLKSDLKLYGTNKAFIVSSVLSSSFIKGLGTYESTNVYQYTLTGEEESGKFFITIDNINYALTIPEQHIAAGTELTFTPKFKKCILRTTKWTNDLEQEYNLEIIEETTEYIDITSELTQKSKSLPNEYIKNIEINNLGFINNRNDNQDKFALFFRACKDIKVINCQCFYMGLITCSLDVPADSASTSYDSYINSGLNTDLLSSDIHIENNVIRGHEKDHFMSISNDSVPGIYIGFSKNVNVINNDISWFRHGVSVWGGNVGTAYLALKNGIKFCNNLIFTNNRIENVRMGGIWTSRASNVIVNSNYLNNGGDVGIDFEGSYDCVADGNVSNNFVSGSLSTFFGSTNIIFSNNNCLADDSHVQRLFYYSNPGTYKDFCTIKLIGNTFTSKYWSRKLLILGGFIHSDIFFENNSFENSYIQSTQNNNCILHVLNNKFFIDSTISTLTGSFIDMKQTDSRNIPQAYIKNNLFKALFIANGSAPSNNSIFDEFYPIKYEGSRWRDNISLQIEENTFLGFTNIMYINHQRGTGGNQSLLFVNFKRNKTSGKIINESDEYAFIIFDNNKKISNNFSSILTVETNYPNAIPDGSEGYGQMRAYTRIYFDAPDNDGYTGAICTVSGNPGTWKRFGKIED